MCTQRLITYTFVIVLLTGCQIPAWVLATPGLVEPPPSSQPSPIPPLRGKVITPDRLEYLGAFRLPESQERPYTFEYGGNAMTYNPSGDPDGEEDGYPGSLFITGHDRLPYGELPNGSQVAEIDIPAPQEGSVDMLNRAHFLQNFRDVAGGHFMEMEEIVRIGLLYLDTPVTGPLIHISWGQHIEPNPTVPTHGWFSPTLSTTEFKGPWFISDQSWYSINDYMLEIPSDWAEMYTQGYVIGTGRFKDGGWSGMGPALIAYRPWDEAGNPYPAGTVLPAIPLLRYASSTETNMIERSLNGYQHPDEWSGAVWLTLPSGEAAILFAGAKSTGSKYWYGYVNPVGPDFPCIDEEITDFPTCRLDNGDLCPAPDLHECPVHNDYRGWWTSRWDAQFLFYDPADLARVALGEISSWEPQPYAVFDIDEYLLNNPTDIETDMLGTGLQRRYRIGDVTFDRQNGLLYVLELFADGAAPIVHIWELK